MFGLGTLLKYMFSNKEEHDEKQKPIKINYCKEYEEQLEEKIYKESLREYVSYDKFILENGKELSVDYGINKIFTFGSSQPVIQYTDYKLFYDENIFRIKRDFRLRIDDIVKKDSISFTKQIYMNLENKDNLKDLKKLNGLNIKEHKEITTELGYTDIYEVPLRPAGLKI